MTVTADQLVKAGLADAATAAKVVDALNAAMAKFDISSPARAAAFLAQCAHESEQFTHVQENLNYRAETLIKVWPQHFNAENASRYGHKPEAIANRAYAGHMGNRDEASGDGWKFHGRGYIQLTGHDNYQALGAALGEDLLANPDVVADPKHAALSAAWFWQKHGLNELADKKDFVTITKRINGGVIGLADRQALYARALAVFGG